MEIPDESTTTILDVLLRVQREQDPSLAFRYACRVNMCGSCGMVINGRDALACKTNVSNFPPGTEITLRPMNHFPVIRDLVVDMEPFFKKYEETLPFYEPKENYLEPAMNRRTRPSAPTSAWQPSASPADAASPVAPCATTTTATPAPPL